MYSKDLTDFQIALQLFPGYADGDTGIFEEFINREAHPEPGFLTDFLGSRIRTTSVWKAARTLDGQLLGIPVPGDFHAEAIEWIGLLKAVRGAGHQYVSMELGAGFGPWTVAGATAARLRGIQDIRLCAVEGDSQHFRSLRQHFLDNGFEPEAHRLIEAAVGVRAGVAHWPDMDEAAAVEEWGFRPIQPGADDSPRRFQRTKPITVIPMLDLVQTEPLWDLIHIDVQGDEVEICSSCINELNDRVRWIIVGTHSRKLDGDFLELMCKAGWLLEHEKPAKFSYIPNQTRLDAMTTLDGTQVWRNPRLTTSRGGYRLTSFSQQITSSIPRLNLRAGEVFPLPIKVKNTGTEDWFGAGLESPVNASYRWLDSNGNKLDIEGNRAGLLDAVVRPGAYNLLKLDVIAPPMPGSYTLLISMVQESVAWFIDRGAVALALPATVD